MQQENALQSTKDGGEGQVPSSDQNTTQAPTPIDIARPQPSIDASIVFDAKNQRYIVGSKAESTQDTNYRSEGKLVLFDIQGNRVEEHTLSQAVVKGSRSEIENLSENEAIKQRDESGNRFSDNFGILRFVKGQQNKNIDLSASGFTLRYSKKHGQKEDEETVMTNMGFSTGVHIWEIIAPISCNNLSIGVHNPLTKNEVFQSFKTSTPRLITVCLDLNENQLKFWLNDRRNTNKNIKLPHDFGYWIPCVKISVERNKIILNPFAREPSDFYEKDFDKKFTLKKYIMPFIDNMVCITKLPKSESSIQQFMKEVFKMNVHDVNIAFSTLRCLTSDDEKDRFCFMGFHYHETITEFVKKHSAQYKIYLPHEIAEWFFKPDLAPEFKNPLELLTKYIKIPHGEQARTFAKLEEAYDKVQNLKESQNEVHGEEIKVSQQPFTDKMIIVKKDSEIKAITRDVSTSDFHVESYVFGKPVTTLSSLAQFKIREPLLDLLMTCINWSVIFKGSNALLEGVFERFFTDIIDTSHKAADHIYFRSNLVVAKSALEVMSQQMRSQLDRVKRQYQNYQTVVPMDSLINLTKPEEGLDALKGFKFYRDPNLSIDQLYTVIHVVNDLQEQVWAQTRSPLSPPEVKALMRTVSRPHSALSRLGSFITWGMSQLSMQSVADKGFYYKESKAISQIESQVIEISNLSTSDILDEDSLKQYYGQGSRLFNSLISENIPIWKSLNYLAPQKLFSSKEKVLEVIASVNSQFVLIANESGHAQICNSALDLSQLKSINFFQNDLKAKIQGQNQLIAKINQRQDSFDVFKREVHRKSTHLSSLKAIAPISKEQQKAAHLAQAKIKKEIKKKAKAIPAKAKAPKQEKKAKTKSKKTQQQLVVEAEEANIDVLFGETEDKDDASSDLSQMQQIKESEAKVIGYFMLSKPAYDKVALDPLTVGCIYFNLKNSKFYIRARKIEFALHYLLNFIGLDTVTGHQINKISGKQLLNTEDLKELYEDILNHQENIVDLYSLFIRNSLKKSEKSKKEKFTILNDISQAELEIDDCKRIIDFTRTNYAIENQSKIMMLVENLEGKQQAREYKLSSYFMQEQFRHKISIEKTQVRELNKEASRIFSYDDKVLIIGKDYYQIRAQADYTVNKDEALCQELAPTAQITIINKSLAINLFSQQNLHKFAEIASVPQQVWTLSIVHSKDTLHQYQLTNSSEQEENKVEAKEKITEINLKDIPSSDIAQIANLLEFKNQGVLATPHPQSVISSSGNDPQTGHGLSHHWHLIKDSRTPLEFQLNLPKGEANSHLKLIDLKFSFRRQVQAKVQFQGEAQALHNTSTHFDQDDCKRIPLSIESFSGAQSNDFIQPSYIVHPDYNSFSSNYPQPEFIFRHQAGKTFIPTQFVVKSRETREFNGYPISQGLIFVSNTLEDLYNTKSFSKFTLKEYKKWRAERDNSADIPLLPNEPIAYIDLEDQTTITVDVKFDKQVKYIKFVPTAFRRLPINFSSKPFHSNQAEFQFFGVNGFESLPTVASHDHLQTGLSSKDLQVQINGSLESQSAGNIETLSSVVITKLRNPKQSRSEGCVIAMKDLTVPNMVGIASLSVPIREEISDKITEFKLKVQNPSNDQWVLEGVTISVKAYTNSAANFTSENLKFNQPLLRTFLIDPTQFDKLFKQLVDTIQDQSSEDPKKVASIQCILKFLQLTSHEKTHHQYLDLFKKNTQVSLILNDAYVDQSLTYQKLSQQYLSQIGLLKESSDYIANYFLKKQIEQLTSKARPIQKAKMLIELIGLCPAQEKSQINKLLSDILFKQIVNEQLPKLQTPEYITLRSKLGMDQFPFDAFVRSTTEQGLTSDLSNASIGSGNQFLDCFFELHKFNTLYHYNFDLKQKSSIQKLKLFFESDMRNLYKMTVKIIIPDGRGKEIIVGQYAYDENLYSQLTEKIEKGEIVTYFKETPNGKKPKNAPEDQTAEHLELNCLTIDIAKSIDTRFFKLQVELTDTYRSVHKNSLYSPTQIFIRPEVYGQQLSTQSSESDQVLAAFKVRECEPKNHLGEKIYGTGYAYNHYSIPENYLSSSYKACVIKVINKAITKRRDQNQDKQEQPKQDLVTAEQVENEKKIVLEAMDQLSRKVISKNSFRTKLSVLNLMNKNLPPTDGDQKLTLKYVLHLAELIGGQLLQDQSNMGNLIEGSNYKELYLNLFMRFCVYDQKNLYPNMTKLMQELFAKIDDKAALISEIIRDFLMKTEINYNQKSVIEFIQQQKNINFNQLIHNLTISLDLKAQEKGPVASSEIINSVFELIQPKIPAEDNVSIHSLLVLLSVIEELKIEESDQPDVKVNTLFSFIFGLVLRCHHIKDHKHPQGSLALQYCLSVLSKFIKLKSNFIKPLIQEEQKSIAALILLGFKRDEKDIKKLVKQLLLDLVKHDTEGGLTTVLKSLIEWYKETKHIQSCKFYKDLNHHSKGMGTGVFYKDFSLVFKLYAKVLEYSSKEGSEDKLKQAYLEMGDLVSQLLKVLIDEQETPKYEDNFFVVWIQIFKTTIYQAKQSQDLNKIDSIKQVAQAFFKLNELNQDLLYPKFHEICEKSQKLLESKYVSFLFKVINEFLLSGFNLNQKSTYCFIDGLVNIIQSNKKDKQSQASISNKLSANDVEMGLNVLGYYLNNYCNKGIYTGVGGASKDIIMRLDIGIQLSATILYAVDSGDTNAVQAYFKQPQVSVEIVKNLIQWIFLNYSSQKGKSTPSGQKIYTLSQNIEQILNAVSASPEAVSVCLPVLMKSVLETDFKLRDMIHEQKINNERSISIQKTVNTLFLQIFKQWVSSDIVAKKFLTELNGFDFLLDRLFSKREEQPSHRKLSELDQDGEHSEEDNGDEQDQEEEEDQIMSMVLKKLESTQSKKSSATTTSALDLAKKKKEKKLPKMTKQEGLKDEKAQGKEGEDVHEAQIKEVESKLILDDWAKNLKLIWSTDLQKSVASQFASVQWFKSKNGTKNRIYNAKIADSVHDYEFVLVFDLESPIQLNEIQLGILYNWSTYDPDCQYEPLTLILEGGNTQEKADWKVLLKPLEDDGFKMNSVTAYGYSFVDNKAGLPLEPSIEEIGLREARYLTLRFRKPIMSCLDNSMYASCTSKQKSYGISYISVMGNQPQKQGPLYSYLVDIQKENSLEVLSKFFSGEFTEAFETISEQPQIIDKIKNAFDKLSDLLNTKASLIKPIFLAICSKNRDLGDWIMENRLISMNPQQIKKEQIRFLGDIISSNVETQLAKIVRLKDFILSIISKDQKFSPEQQLLLSRYINLYTKKLRDHAHILRSQEKTEDIIHEFEVEHLRKINLTLNDETISKRFYNSLISLSMSLLIPPQPFLNKTIEIDSYVDTMIDNQENLLLCSIIASNNQATVQKMIDKGKITQSLEQFKENPLRYAQIIFNCSKQKIFKDKFRGDLTFKLYEIVTDISGQQEKNEEVIELVVQTIKDLVIGGEEEQEKLSNLLKQDINTASEKGDIFFINKVIVPILHAEDKVPVTISIDDKSSKQKGLFPIYHQVGETNVQKDNFMLQTELLNKKQKATFTKMFKELSADKVDSFDKLRDGRWEMIFEDRTHATQNSQKFKKFVAAVNNKHNIIVLCQAKVQDQQVVFGGFTNKPFPSLGDSWAQEFDYQIPFSEANFVFHYTPEKENHYTMLHNKPFGYIYTDYEEGGAFSVSGDFFLISWSYEFQNSCGNIYDMKCVEETYVNSFYNNMDIQNIEIWWCNPSGKASMATDKIKGEMKKNENFQMFNPYNFFRDNLVFELSREATLGQLSYSVLGKVEQFVKYPGDEIIADTTKITDVIQGQSINTDPILDLVIRRDQPQKTEEDKKESPVNEEFKQIARIQPLLKKFETKGGIFDLIKAAKAAVKLYKGDKLREMWGLWLVEIESFSQLPSFFEKFCQDHSKEVIIYNLLEGQYDIQDRDQQSPENLKIIQKQEELHIEMVKYSYKIVGQVFETHEGVELRESCLKNGTFERFIERIGQLSSEKKRYRVDKASRAATESESSPEKGAELKDGEKKPKKMEKDKKRKGVGYTTGVGTTWNVSEYLKSKEAKSQQAANIVDILKNMIKAKDWEVPKEIKDLLLESSLLPTLESAFRSGSLLDMAKDFDLNMAYLGFVEELSNHNTLIDLLLDIGEDYEPRQKEPIYQLLKKIGELSKIFLECLPADEKSKPVSDDPATIEAAKPRMLAECIQNTNNVVQQKIKEQQNLIKERSLQEILEMPLSEAYKLLLSDLRFEYMSIKSSSGIYNHAYAGDLPKGLNPPVTKLVRLAQEIADLSNSLPCDHTDAVFCRVDKERVDVMKCMIMGASGTPYAHGAFVYDLFFENNYPQGPPKCQLVTTGGNTVRFNPNLYNNGKVCLSLLGTWRGSSTENWDPKLSTILQVLLSIQAIIMSNEVYFNEPGYEHEQGTPDGERKNEGYGNIVRYCNVKFAMIDAIKNPPAGFEKVIKRSFYLKKNEILREVKEWVDRAKVTDALYTGLVYDHNYTWAPQISPEGKYAEMMEAVYKELKETLESIPSPFEDEATGQKIERKFSEREEEEPAVGNEKTSTKIDEIDVSYEPTGTLTSQAIDIEDDKVKDRWSRYIGAMGIEAVAKQAEARILIIGMGALGVEIAKNVVLAGCKELLIFDQELPNKEDLCGQFFITDKDTEDSKTRAQCTKDKLQQLNYYVKVTSLDEHSIESLKNFIKDNDLKVVVLTDLAIMSRTEVYDFNKVCREKKTAFIQAYQNGLFSRVFNDFGEEFIVVDKDGEDLQEVMIQDISYDEAKSASVVTLLEGFKHKYQDGDQVTLKEVLGMTKGDQTINNTVQTIKVISPSQFSISEDVREYTKYEGNGVAKQVKVPKKMSFLTLEEADKLEEEKKEPVFDQNLVIADFEKVETRRMIHLVYQIITKVLNTDTFFDIIDGQNFASEIYEKIVKPAAPSDFNEDQLKKLKEVTVVFALTMRMSFASLSAFIGGIVAQEIVKAITQKFSPIQQLFYYDCLELFPFDQIDTYLEDFDSFQDKLGNSRYGALSMMIGEDLMYAVHRAKVFMIGAGAIGCELLKNYAMIGLGVMKEGMITLTDPDVIEVSNLNRQFLFREKHLRKPKSQTAAAAAVQMNPDLKGHISANLDKIHEGTAHIYDEKFFQSQSIVTNALDNVAARLFIDGKCVAARTPLIDSGTLGSKGHVQIVLPQYQTESYASMQDPEDNTEIPHCTLKMFPEEILHCIEWAKDIFGNLFTLQPQSFNKIVSEEGKEPNFQDQQELVSIKKAIKMIEKQPKTIQDCLQIARAKFQKYFHNDIKQLLHVYPLDKMTKEGRPFWSLPKRPPHAMEFKPEDQIHAQMVASTACLIATIYNIPIPFDQPRSKESRLKMAVIASEFKQPEFVPNDLKANEIQSQVEKAASKDEEQKEETSEETKQKHDPAEIKNKLESYLKPLLGKKEAQMKVEEFEKDNDQNYHIDFIHAMANIRAANYKLQEMDWINVKIKAGRIVPALATTTAAIAGLQTIELIKYLKNCKLTEHRNSFINLAVPSMMMSEPGAAIKKKLMEGLEVNLWTRFEYETNNKQVKFQELISYLEAKYKGLKCRDIFHGSVPLFLHALAGKDEQILQKPILDAVTVHNKDKLKFLDLTITFVEEKAGEDGASEKMLEGVPPVRVIFKK